MASLTKTFMSSPKTSALLEMCLQFMAGLEKQSAVFISFQFDFFFFHLYPKIKRHILSKNSQIFEEYKKQNLEWDLKH